MNKYEENGVNEENKCKNCLNENRIKDLENKIPKYEMLKIIMTPKMIIAICIGLSFLVQMVRGG